MNKQTLDTLRVWFSAYTQTFHTDDKEIQSEVSLKECHTIRVVEHCHNLAAWLRFNTKDIYLAEAVGLCHDIGRFKQVTQYRTINDIESVDHAALGVAEMIAANIPNKVESADWEILSFAVAAHNAIVIPATTNERSLIFAKIIRDADKLDIYRIFPPQPNSSACSPFLLNNILLKQPIDYKDVATVDDFKLVMISWIYNINFSWTIEQIAIAGYINVLFNSLPNSSLASQVQKQVCAYLTSAEK